MGRCVEKWKELSGLVQAILAFCGVDISGPMAELIAILLFFGSLAITSGLIAHRCYLWLRRRMGDTRAISDEQLAVVKLIKQDIDGIKRTVNHIGSSLNDNFKNHIGSLSDQLIEVSKTITVVEEEAVGEKKSVRLFFAEQVRETVMERFEAGRWFQELPDQRHAYIFDATSQSGVRYVMRLQTPYRFPYQRDDLHDYVLDIRVNGKKAILFQWDIEGERPHHLYLSRSREWINEIKGWSFSAIAASKAERMQAAE